MEIKEKDLYLAKLLEKNAIKQDEFEDIEYKPEINAFDSKYLKQSFVDKINFGWSVWQEQTTPEGFVLVPKVITDEWMAVYVDPEVSKYCKEFEGLPFAVTEKDLPMIQEDFRRPIKAAHSRLMKVIEAQEQSHD